MSDDLDKMLAEEAEHAEQHMDAEPGPHTKVSRPNRTRSNVFSVRLNDEEMRQLAAAAEKADIPPSTMARTMIAKQLEGVTLQVRQHSQEAVQAVVTAASESFQQALRDLALMREWMAASGLDDPKVRQRILQIAESARRPTKQ